MKISSRINESVNKSDNKAKRFADKAYRVKDWVTLKKDEDILTMEEALASDTNFKYIDVDIPAEVIAKETEKDGKKKLFHKLKIYYQGGGYFEYDLPFNRDLLKDIVEGTEMDTKTICFYTEEKLGEYHDYALGEIIE